MRRRQVNWMRLDLDSYLEYLPDLDSMHRQHYPLQQSTNELPHALPPAPLSVSVSWSVC